MINKPIAIVNKNFFIDSIFHFLCLIFQKVAKPRICTLESGPAAFFSNPKFFVTQAEPELVRGYRVTASERLPIPPFSNFQMVGV
jgi:hypothetical protein